MSNRLTDDQLGWFDRYIRPGYDEMASGDDMLALVAEVREHRATIERVRSTVQAWRDEQNATENDQDMLNALADEVYEALGPRQ